MNVIKYFLFLCSVFSVIKDARGTQDLIAQIPGVSELAMRIASLTDIGSSFFSAERSSNRSVHEKIAAKTRSLDPETIQLIRDTAEGITSFLNDLSAVAFAVESALNSFATRDNDKSKLVAFRDTLEIAYSKTLNLFQKYQDAFGEKVGARTALKGGDNEIDIFPPSRGTDSTRGGSSTSRLSGFFSEDTLLNPVNALRGDIISNRLISMLDADNLNLSNNNNNKPDSSISNVFGRLTRKFSNDAKGSRSESSNANDANTDGSGNEISAEKDISQRKLRDLQKAYREWRESIDKLGSFSDAFKSASTSAESSRNQNNAAIERNEKNTFQEVNDQNSSNRRALMVSLDDYDKVAAGSPVAAADGFNKKVLRKLIVASDRAADTKNRTSLSSATGRTMKNPSNNDLVQNIQAALSPQTFSSSSPLSSLSYIASAPSNMLASAETVVADTRDTLIDRAAAPFASDKKSNGRYVGNNNLLITPVPSALLLPTSLQPLSTLNSIVSVPSTMIAAADLALTNSRDALLDRAATLSNSPAAIRDVLLNRPTSSSTNSSASIKGIGQSTKPATDHAFEKNVSNNAVENASPLGSFENALHSLNERLKQVTQNPGI